jgi:hypothetical protein
MGRTIRINGIDVPVIEDEMTGADIKRAAGVPADRVLIQQEQDRNTIVPDAQRVRVADGGVFAHHARHSKASAARAGGEPGQPAGAATSGGEPGQLAGAATSGDRAATASAGVRSGR